MGSVATRNFIAGASKKCLEHLLVDLQRNEADGRVTMQEVHASGVVTAEAVAISQNRVLVDVDVVGLHPGNPGPHGLADKKRVAGAVRDIANPHRLCSTENALLAQHSGVI